MIQALERQTFEENDTGACQLLSNPTGHGLRHVSSTGRLVKQREIMVHGQKMVMVMASTENHQAKKVQPTIQRLTLRSHRTSDTAAPASRPGGGKRDQTRSLSMPDTSITDAERQPLMWQ